MSISDEAKAVRFKHGRTLDELVAKHGIAASPAPPILTCFVSKPAADARMRYLDAIYRSPELPHRIAALLARQFHWLRWLGKSTEDPGYIYFVLAPELKRIKVGFSRDVAKRFSSIRNAAPCAVELVTSVRAKPYAEIALLEYLSDHQAYGEWHHFSQRVIAVVDTAVELGKE